MHLWEGMTYGQIAAELAIAETTVIGHMALARKRIAKAYSLPDKG